MSSPVYRVLDAGTTDSGAVVVPNADVVVADADVVESAEANVLNPDVNNAARGDDVDLVSENGSSVHEIGQEIPRSSVNGESYAARTAGLREPPRRQALNNNHANDVPDRPRSAFFTPARSTSARSVFDALKAADITPREIACMQRRMNGEVVITFKSPAAKEKFLRLNSLSVQGDSYAIQDIDRPLTFLTIYDAPFELSELAIINRLAPYCEVLHYRRGRFPFQPGICNGIRHYRVRVIKPIPSFLRFGKLLLFLRHEGQVPTCRRCNQPGHFSNQCNNKICFNCEQLGHEAPACPAPMLCSICKSDDHLGRQCPYSWYAVPTSRAPGSVSPSVSVEDDQQSNSSDVDSLQWLRNVELSDDENDENDVPTEKMDESADNDKNDKTDENEKNDKIDENGKNDEIAENEEIAENVNNEEIIENDSSLDDPHVVDSVQSSPAVEIAETSALNSQGFLLNQSTPDVTPVQRPPLPAPDSPEPSDAVIVLDSLAHPAPDVSDNTSTDTSTSDPVPPPDPASTSATTSTSDPPILSRLRGRRAPAPLPEALSCLQRKATPPVLVTSRPKPAPESQTDDDDSMETAVNLKRKSAPPKSAGKKGRKK